MVKKVLGKRGTHTGLVHIISAMETCGNYRPWHDKQSGKTFLKSSQSKCLQSIYSELTATAMHTVKPDNVATFPGYKVDPRYQGEIGNNYNIRIETTTNDVSFLKYYREVEHRNGTLSMPYAHLKKNIYSLTLQAFLFKASNKRYLEFFREESICKKCKHFEECHNANKKCWVEIIKAYGRDNWDYPDPSPSLRVTMSLLS